MILTNQQIYETYQKLAKVFLNETRYFPAKVNFIIQKNLKTLYEIAQEIENMRLNIINHYGKIHDDDYIIYPENIEQANKELDDLSTVKQEVNILFLTFEDIANIEFTPAQMGAILFMINEGEE